MNVPVFGETVTFTNLSSIAVTVGSIVSFNKGRINHPANRRCLYRRIDSGFAAEYSSQINLNHSTFPTYLVNSGISQAFDRNMPGTFRTATFAGKWWRNFPAVSLQNSPFIRFILIRCNQIHNTTMGPFLQISHKFFDVFGRAFARYNTYYQAMLRVIRHMVPVVSLSPIIRNIVITMLSFLTHKGPFLIKLYLIGFRGKTLPAHREAPWHVCRQAVNNASQYFCLRQPDVLFYALHSFRKCAQAMRWPFSHQASYGTRLCLFVRKIVSCTFGNIAAGYGYFCQICHRLTNYLHHVFRNLGIFYFDNRILKELALSYLLNVTLYGTTICPSFRISAKTSKIIQSC